MFAGTKCTSLLTIAFRAAIVLLVVAVCIKPVAFVTAESESGTPVVSEPTPTPIPVEQTGTENGSETPVENVDLSDPETSTQPEDEDLPDPETPTQPEDEDLPDPDTLTQPEDENLTDPGNLTQPEDEDQTDPETITPPEDVNDDSDDATEDVTEVPSEIVDDVESPTTTEDDDLDEASPTATETPTIEPTDTVSDDASPTATETPTPTPTEVPADVATPTEEAPTSTPVPQTLAWNQQSPITCVVDSGNPGSLNLNDTATYRCEAAITITTTGDLPTDLALIWDVTADYAGDNVALRLPVDAVGEVLPSPADHDAQMRVQLPYTSDGEQRVTFEVVVTRTSCTVGDAGLTLSATPSFANADSVAVTQSGEQVETSVLTTTAAPNSQVLTVSMHASDFAPVQYSGTKWGATYATITLTVDGPVCPTSADSTVYLEVLVDNPGLQPRVAEMTSDTAGIVVNPAPDTQATRVAVADIPAGFAGSGVITVDLALQPDDSIGVGTYQINLSADVVSGP